MTLRHRVEGGVLALVAGLLMPTPSARVDHAPAPISTAELESLPADVAQALLDELEVGDGDDVD